MPAHCRTERIQAGFSHFRLLLFGVAVAFLCCQCRTGEDSSNVISSLDQESKFGRFGKLTPVGEKRQSGYKFKGINDHELESNKSEGGERVSNTTRNERVIRNREGEVVRVEKRDDLYSDRSSHTANETGRSFTGKKAKLKKDEFASKEFRKPEYLKRQEFAATQSFREADQTARESGEETTRFSKLFKTNSHSATNQAAAENGSRNRLFNKTFDTNTDRTAARAQRQAAIPDPVNATAGYQDNAAMTMDDVKKLVNPEASR